MSDKCERWNVDFSKIYNKNIHAAICINLTLHVQIILFDLQDITTSPKFGVFTKIKHQLQTKIYTLYFSGAVCTLTVICMLQSWSVCAFQVAIADHNGILQVFGMKKGEPQVGIVLQIIYQTGVRNA